MSGYLASSSLFISALHTEDQTEFIVIIIPVLSRNVFGESLPNRTNIGIHIFNLPKEKRYSNKGHSVQGKLYSNVFRDLKTGIITQSKSDFS